MPTIKSGIVDISEVDKECYRIQKLIKPTIHYLMKKGYNIQSIISFLNIEKHKILDIHYPLETQRAENDLLICTYNSSFSKSITVMILENHYG